MSLKSPYREIDFSTAIDALLQSMDENGYSLDGDDPRIETLRRNHPVIDEILECGVNGPAGIGLGKCGGHSLGE